MMTAAQCAIRARLASRALYAVAYSWHRHQPDCPALASAAKLTDELRQCIAALRDAQKKKAPDRESN